MFLLSFASLDPVISANLTVLIIACTYEFKFSRLTKFSKINFSIFPKNAVTNSELNINAIALIFGRKLDHTHFSPLEN